LECTEKVCCQKLVSVVRKGAYVRCKKDRQQPMKAMLAIKQSNAVSWHAAPASSGFATSAGTEYPKK
jgi:hypothetical protein